MARYQDGGLTVSFHCPGMWIGILISGICTMSMGELSALMQGKASNIAHLGENDIIYFSAISLIMGISAMVLAYWQAIRHAWVGVSSTNGDVRYHVEHRRYVPGTVWTLLCVTSAIVWESFLIGSSLAENHVFSASLGLLIVIAMCGFLWMCMREHAGKDICYPDASAREPRKLS
jgi:magnesium-transporting ATPase (P-type)